MPVEPGGREGEESLCPEAWATCLLPTAGKDSPPLETAGLAKGNPETQYPLKIQAISSSWLELIHFLSVPGHL